MLSSSSSTPEDFEALDKRFKYVFGDQEARQPRCGGVCPPHISATALWTFKLGQKSTQNVVERSTALQLLSTHAGPCTPKSLWVGFIKVNTYLS